MKSDKKSKRYRDMVAQLNTFSAANEVPEHLQSAMGEHLQLTAASEQVRGGRS